MLFTLCYLRISELFTKTLREPPKDEMAINAQLLERGGFVYKNSAGIYTFLPLGWRVIQKIANIVRKEMDAIGGQEVFMPALIERKYMEPTSRWDVDIGYKFSGHKLSAISYQPDFVLGWTHEEVLTAIAAKYVSSHKDLPFAAYQIQTKFRNEPRAKSGLLRGREFIMKDLYSFHTSEQDLFDYYHKVRQAYERIFEHCGLKTVYTLAAGGTFTIADTHEFQVVSPIGEDTIFVCEKCDYAENQELVRLKEGDACPRCAGLIIQKRAIEVGNIFPLGTKFSRAFGLNFRNIAGDLQPVVMGSYGLGISRLVGTIVEIYNDAHGIIWPESVSPFKVQLIELRESKIMIPESGVKQETEKIYQELQAHEIEVLYDDRAYVSAGEKFMDADLIGCPLRLVVSERTLDKRSVEIKRRNETKTSLVPLINYLRVLK